MEYEMLTCEFCRYRFERMVQRGRKPRLCDYCRSDGIKLRPKAPAAPRAARPGGVVGVLEITDGGKSADGFAFERNDCTVRALAVACEAPYKDAYTYMARMGRRRNKGAYFRSIIARNPEVFGRKLEPVAVQASKGIRTFLLRNPQMRKGTWILHMTRHVAVLRNGRLLDSFDSSRKMIDGAWRVSPA